ncbi:MAG: hypothetical protein SFT92_01145 [Rickettsiales bacterium]|nr:hypothetical protein [Rickettsiales bacterium]
MKEPNQQNGAIAALEKAMIRPITRATTQLGEHVESHEWTGVAVCSVRVIGGLAIIIVCCWVFPAAGMIDGMFEVLTPPKS